MNHSTLGLPVYHQLPEFTQTHVRRASDAIQPRHPLSSPSPPAATRESPWSNGNPAQPAMNELFKKCSTSLVMQFSSVQSLSRVRLFVTPMNRSTPGLPVHHQLPEFTQIHVHRVSDAIQPSHPLSSPSPPALNPSKHQSVFQ